MAGLMGGLDAESYDRQLTDRELYRRILGCFSVQQRQLIWLGTLVFLQGLVGTAVPMLVSQALDLLARRSSIQVAALVVAIVTVLGGLDWLLNYRKQAIAARAVGDVVSSVRNDALAATLRRDMRFFDRHPPGRLISRITSDTQELGTLVTLVTEMLSSLVIVVLVAGVMGVKNWRLGLLALVTVPAIWLATLAFRSVARRLSIGSRRILAILNGQINEAVSGISIAKGFRQEAAILSSFQDSNEQSYQVNLRQGWTFNTIFPLLNAINGIGTATLVYFGGMAALRQVSWDVSPGDWYFFIQASALIFFPLTSLASFYSQLQLGLSASERVFALLDQDSELRQARPGQDPGKIQGAITFRNVQFHYVEREPVFRGLDLEIAPGESVALVGHTGAGKSSIVNLLARYYEFQAGTIEVDGRDLRSLDLDLYRRQVGVILQEQLLFDATVADNIRYGRPDASDEEVRAALERIGAQSLVEELPEGLHTRVRERGSRLSLGQRQLVSLARTMLQDPAILILDEATASVDPLTEVQLQRALEKVMAGRTTIVIAHRLTTIRHVDRILVLEQGQVVEEGTHEALLHQDSRYAHLYHTYFRHQSLEYIESMHFSASLEVPLNKV